MAPVDIESSGGGAGEETKVAEAPAPGFAAEVPHKRVSEWSVLGGCAVPACLRVLTPPS